MALDLGKQIGPLPLGAWIGVVAGGLGIAWYTKRNPAATDDGTGESFEENPGVGTGAVGGWIPTTPGANTDTSVAPDKAPTTNEEWGQKAINWLIAQNYSPTLADSAIRKYLAAESLSVSENVLVGLALGKLGSPPSPLPPTSGTNPPNTPITPKPPVSVPEPVKPKPAPPKPKPAPAPKYRYYTVKRGDTLWGISAKYYGTGIKYGTIFNANRSGKKRADGKTGMIVKASLIQPGWVLLIP